MKNLETRIWILKVLTLLDIKMHQLFGLCKEGHLQAYDNLGRKVVDINSCEKGIKRSYEEIELSIRQNEYAKIADSCRPNPSYGVREKALTKREINSKALEEYNAQPLDTPINPDPENCVLFDFTPSKKNFNSAMTFEFGEDEILNLVKEKILLKSEADQRPTKKAPGDFTKKEIFPCAAGTKWKDIKITLVENDTVRVETPQGKGLFTYHQLGMSDKRSGNKPTVLWFLFTQFCKNQGLISPKDPGYIDDLAKAASRLNIHLEKLFGINESIYTGHYKKLKRIYSDQEKAPHQDTKTTSKVPRTVGYKTRIFFSDQTNVTF
jgi:hypothetical protein